MNEIEQKALAVVRDASTADELRILPQYVDKAVLCEALCRAVEQHEQFKREVSDAVLNTPTYIQRNFHLLRFILPKPVDPLVEAWDAAWGELSDKPAKLETFREALAKRGGKIVWENEP